MNLRLKVEPVGTLLFLVVTCHPTDGGWYSSWITDCSLYNMLTTKWAKTFIGLIYDLGFYLIKVFFFFFCHHLIKVYSNNN